MTHLIVVHHGMWGNASHMEYLNSRLIGIVKPNQQEKDDDEHQVDVKSVPPIKQVTIHNCTSNEGSKSLEGIDICGERVWDEIEQFLDSLTHISFVGYSWGGLVLRYVIGKFMAKGLFNRICPMFYISIASPHLGARVKPGGFLNFFSGTAGLSGRQLFLEDNCYAPVPLLLIMSNPNGPFVQGLSLFRHRMLLANIKNDRLVRYCTASISESNPFRRQGIKKAIEAPIPHIVEADPTSPYDAGPWKVVHLILIPFGLLAFILSPLLLSYLGVQFVKHNHPWRRPHPKRRMLVKWLSVDELIPEKRPIPHSWETRIYMIKNMNTLNWTKWNVCLELTNAHGSIIQRKPWQSPDTRRVMDTLAEFIHDKYLDGQS